MTQVHFPNVQKDRIKLLFLEVYKEFDVLQGASLSLERAKLKDSTMQAQPVIGVKGLFSKANRYRIRLAKHVRDTKHLLVDELPDEVLKGWFAHELGHVVDYHSRSPLEMLVFGVRYLLSGNYRRMVEHKADQIAIQHGFFNEILKTKEFLFNNELIHEAYRKKMMRYYMSIDEATIWMKENVQIDPVE